MDKPKPKDVLYEKIKKEKYKHSAYRSGLIVKKYKSEYMKKYKNEDGYWESLLNKFDNPKSV